MSNDTTSKTAGVTVTASISQNLDLVQKQINNACHQYARKPDDINLLAVSKTKPLSMIKAGLAAGQYHYGENYLQDALAKISTCQEPNVVWHFIGAIQSNKTRLIAENFSWVHTVASEKIATRLNNQRPDHLAKLQVLIQVNIDHEAAKSGLLPDDLNSLINNIQALPRIELRGLMAIPKATQDFANQRDAFRRLKQLQQKIAQAFELTQFDQLSMGMSNDLEAAIAEGSTMLRIGTAIFGKRESKPT